MPDCSITPISATVNCGSLEGGILYSYVVKLESITAITIDANEQITAITMASVGLWEKWEYDIDNTALFEEPGSLNGDRITYAQRSFQKYKGYTNAYRQTANKAAACCNVVAIHFTAAGIAVVQGLEINAAAVGGFTKTKGAETRVVPTRTTDTSLNTPRMEFSIQGVANNLAPTTTLTATNIEAL